MKGCRIKSKYLLVVFNLLLMTFGMVTIATGYMDMDLIIMGFGGMEPYGYQTSAVLMAVGVLMIIVAFLGFFGLWKESPKLLNIYAVCTFAIIIMQLVLCVATGILRSEITTTMKPLARTSFLKNRDGGTNIEKHESQDPKYSTYIAMWDRIQRNLECCGSSTPNNYNVFQPFKDPPFSCCPLNNTDHRPEEIQRADCVQTKQYYKEGCENKLLSTVHSSGMKLILGQILICLAEMGGIFLMFWVAYGIRVRRKRHFIYPSSSHIPINH